MANQLPGYEAKLREFKRDVHAMLPKIQAAVPDHVRPNQLIRTLFNAIEANPKLLQECSSASIGKCLVAAATYGLEIANGQLGHCYLVPYGNAKSSEKTAQLQLSYKGIKELVRRSGEGMIFMDAVHEGDEFEDRGADEKPHHRKAEDQNRFAKPLTHAYAYVKLRNGFIVAKVMTRAACLAHRNQYSKTWANAVRYKKERDEKWHEDNPAFPKMCMKTCVHGLANDGDLPMSADLREAMNVIEGEASDAPSTIDVVAPKAIEHESTQVEKPSTQVEPEPSAPAAVDLDRAWVEKSLNEVMTLADLDAWIANHVEGFEYAAADAEWLMERCQDHRDTIEAQATKQTATQAS